MKSNLPYLPFLFLAVNTCFAQNDGYSKKLVDLELLNSLSIKKYEVYAHEYWEEKTVYHNKLVELCEFENRRQTFGYYYNWDAVNNTDSTYFSYDPEGRLIEIKEISWDTPQGEYQWQTLKSVNEEPDRDVDLTKLVYDNHGNLLSKKFYVNDRLYNAEYYEYNSDNELIAMKYSDEISAANSFHESYTYNKQGAKAESSKVYEEDTTTTYVSQIIHDQNDRIFKESRKAHYTTKQLVYQYDKRGNLIRKEISTEFKLSLPDEFEVYEYTYNAKDQLIREKRTKNEEVRDITTFVYDDEGLKVEEVYLDKDTGEPSRSFRIKYYR